MVNVARESLPTDRVRLLVGRLEDPFPEEPFDLVVCVLRFITSKHKQGRSVPANHQEARAGRPLVLADVVSRSIPRTK